MLPNRTASAVVAYMPRFISPSPCASRRQVSLPAGTAVEEVGQAAGQHARLRQFAGAVARPLIGPQRLHRSEEHTSELQSLMRISYAVFCLKKKKTKATQD